jgi:multiple sugar transport system permease protein
MVGGQRLSRRAFGICLPLLAYLVFLLFPFYWMAIVSFKPTNDLFELQYNPFWIQHFTSARSATSSGPTRSSGAR